MGSAGAACRVTRSSARTGVSGYFDQYKFDRATGVGSDPGYDAAFDALEVWNGRNAEARAPVIDDFFALYHATAQGQSLRDWVLNTYPGLSIPASSTGSPNTRNVRSKTCQRSICLEHLSGF